MYSVFVRFLDQDGKVIDFKFGRFRRENEDALRWPLLRSARRKYSATITSPSFSEAKSDPAPPSGASGRHSSSIMSGGRAGR